MPNKQQTLDLFLKDAVSRLRKANTALTLIREHNGAYHKVSADKQVALRDICLIDLLGEPSSDELLYNFYQQLECEMFYKQKYNNLSLNG